MNDRLEQAIRKAVAKHYEPVQVCYPADRQNDAGYQLIGGQWCYPLDGCDAVENMIDTLVLVLTNSRAILTGTEEEVR
jgi:hypothetical protein